jgi:Polyketide cyclase / dehydrase and lipid transport
MKWVFIILAVLAGIILLVAVIGYCLPVKHSATISVTIHASQEKVWRRLIDFRAFPQWRNSLQRVEPISDSEWTEVDRHNQRLPMKIVSADPGRILTAITGKDLPFGGGWEFTLRPRGSDTQLMITENGEVYNPIFRFVSKFIMGHTATMRQYAADLARSFGG